MTSHHGLTALLLAAVVTAVVADGGHHGMGSHGNHGDGGSTASGSTVFLGHGGHTGHGAYGVALDKKAMRDCELVKLDSSIFHHDETYAHYKGEGRLTKNVTRAIVSVTLIDLHSAWPCTLDETYGYTIGGHSVWTARGCDATFKVCMVPKKKMKSDARDPCWGLACDAKGYICDRRHCVCQCSHNVTLEHGKCGPTACPTPHAVCVPKGDSHACRCPDCRHVNAPKVCGKVGDFISKYENECAMRRKACELGEARVQVLSLDACNNQNTDCTREYRSQIYTDPSGCTADREVDVGQCSGGCQEDGACCQPSQLDYVFAVMTCPDGSHSNKFIQVTRSCDWHGARSVDEDDD